MSKLKSTDFTDRDFYCLDSIGLAIGRQMITGNAIKGLISLAKEIGAKQHGKFPIMGRDPMFMELMAHPWVLQGCERAMGAGFRFDHCFGLKQEKGSGLANLHGGPLTCQGSSFYVPTLSSFGGCLSGRISVGIPLTSQNRKTGGLCYVPGSHKSCWKIHGSEVLKNMFAEVGFDDEFIAIPTLNPGDIILFVDALVHGTSPWRLAPPRVSLYYMYSPPFMAWRSYSEIEQYLPLATSVIQKRLLRPPFVAEITESASLWGENRWRCATKQ